MDPPSEPVSEGRRTSLQCPLRGLFSSSVPSATWNNRGKQPQAAEAEPGLLEPFDGDPVFAVAEAPVAVVRAVDFDFGAFDFGQFVGFGADLAPDLAVFEGEVSAAAPAEKAWRKN